MTEKKEPEVVQTEPMSMVATVDVRDASAHGLALMEERVTNQKKMLQIAIGLTSPSQWVVFSGKDSETCYPTGGASDTILRRAFGLTWRNKRFDVQDTEDGKMVACTAELWRGQEFLEEFTGYRYMAGFVKNMASLYAGAEENLKSKAVRDIMGLRFRTPAEMKELGLDIGKLKRRAEFQDHSDNKNPGEATVPFGKHKGELVADQTDNSLEWLGKAVRKSVEDPAKAKWKDKNQQLLDAITAEWKRRHAPKAAEASPDANAKPQEEPPPPDGEFDFGPPPMSEEETKEALDNAREREPGQDG